MLFYVSKNASQVEKVAKNATHCNLRSSDVAPVVLGFKTEAREAPLEYNNLTI